MKLQRIDRLTPLADIIGLLGNVAPVTPVERDVTHCLGCVLAEDLVAPRSTPALPVALRDGWAVLADALAGAGPYAPLPVNPVPRWVNQGDQLPAGADSVAPFDAINFSGESAQAIAQVVPGEGVLQQGEDARSGAILKRAGSRLRAVDAAAAAFAGARAKARKPRFALLQGGEHKASLVSGFLANAIVQRGGVIEMGGWALDRAAQIDCDAVISVGGTGSGQNDRAISTLASLGGVAVYGIAIAPGESSALGTVQGRPVLLLPGRFDAALAGWLLIGQPLLDALAGYSEGDKTTTVTLTRKIASAPGIAEVVPLRCEGNEATPLASGVLSLQSLSAAQGWVLVPADSEGFAEGTTVEMRPLP
jgi:molybdopterin molybdotransferase